MNDRELKTLVNSCLKKKRYNSEKAALDAINKVHKKRNTELRVYFCKLCLGYHLTHLPLREKLNVKYESRKINECAITK